MKVMKIKRLKIREWCAIRELTLKDVAKTVGRSQKTIQNWIDGKTMPDLDDAIKLAQLFKCEVQDLY